MNFKKCVSFDKLSVEVTLYWLTLIEYFQDKDEIDDIIPELSSFCAYIEMYCQSVKTNMDKWEKMEYQYVLQTLAEILYMFDLGDEVGRGRLAELIESLLRNYDVGERVIVILVRCTENLIENHEKRSQIFIDIINDLLDTKNSKLNNLSTDRVLIEEYLEQLDPTLKLKYTSLKLKILELKELEANLIEKKNHAQAEKIADQLNECREEYNKFIKFLSDQITQNASTSTNSSKILEELRQIKKVTHEIIVKCLKIAFYMAASKK